jgi:hypothetical protein
MSHILFGDCIISNENYQKIDEVKFQLSQRGIRLFMNAEINFYSDIQVVLREQSEGDQRQIFCFTSDKQLTNSDDLLFPYDKFSEEELFPDGENRVIFNELCKKNLDDLKQCIEYFLEVIKPQETRVFLTEGYDSQFQVFHCSIDDMINHIFEQVISAYYLDSVIYNIEK